MLSGAAVAIFWFSQMVGTVLLTGIGMAGIAAAGIAVADRWQTKDSIRHNMPLLGRLVPLIDWFGKFARSHATAGDRENQPINRNQMDQIREMALTGKPAISALGSTRDLRVGGTALFVNSQYPILDNEAEPTRPMVIGPDCEHPFTVRSIFNMSAISSGASGDPFLEACAKAAQRAGCWINSGEGGLSEAHTADGCDLIFQIGTAKYGVRDKDGNLDEGLLREIARHAKAIEIKMAQGAKAGKGGVLPGIKVSEKIAARRGIAVGKDSISPNRHKDIDNNTQLLDRIDHIRTVTGLPVGTKIVLSEPEHIESLCEAILDRGIESSPDFITLDGGEGGSGAAPTILMDSMGISIHESLPMLTTALVKYGLKDRIRTIASGKMFTPDAAAWALCAGADFVNGIRGPMIAAGCVASGECNKDTCVADITTQNPELLKAFNVAVQSTKIKNYVTAMNAGMEMIAHSCGVKDPRDLRPHHVRIVAGPAAQTVRMDKLYPGIAFERPC